MEQNNEPEALDVANQLEKGFITLGKTARALRYEAAEAIRHLHARVQELEAMLEAVGAGGVSAQRVTQADGHIAQNRKIAAPVVLPEPDEYQYRMKPNWDDKLPWTPWEACSKESAANLRKRKEIHDWIYEVRERYTEQQVRELLATPNNLPAQAVERSATHGMNIHQRILHVGGRENAQTYIEFGSVAAVRALVAQVLRDLPDGAQGFAMPAPQPRADALDAERWRFIKRKLCLTGNGDGTCAMQALNLPARITGWPDVGELAIAQFLDAAIDAAIAAAKENK